MFTNARYQYFAQNICFWRMQIRQSRVAGTGIAVVVAGRFLGHFGDRRYAARTGPFRSDARYPILRFKLLRQQGLRPNDGEYPSVPEAL